MHSKAMCSFASFACKKGGDRKMQRKQGISLIVLVITIIVMIILAAAIILSLNNAGIIGNANQAVFKQNINNYLSELDLYYMDALVDNPYANTKNIKATATTSPSITDLIPSISKEDKTKFRVAGGELIYIGANRSEYEWCRELGIKIDSTNLTKEQYEALYEEEIASLEDKIDISGTTYWLTLSPDTDLVVVPFGIETIGDFSFSDNRTKTVILPDGLKTIGEYGFQSGEALEYLILPSSVVTIDEEAFSNCQKLKNIELSNDLESIGPYAFSDCKSLETITIPAKVKTINSFAFRDCSNLKTIYIESEVLSSVADNAFTTIAEGSVIYVRSESVANFLAEKYDISKTTISTDYNW